MSQNWWFCRSAAHGTFKQLHVMLMRCHVFKGTTSSLCATIRAEHVQPGRRVLKLQQHQRSHSSDGRTHGQMPTHTPEDARRWKENNLWGNLKREVTSWTTFLWNSSAQSGGSSKETSVFWGNSQDLRGFMKGNMQECRWQLSNQPPWLESFTTH